MTNEEIVTRSEFVETMRAHIPEQQFAKEIAMALWEIARRLKEPGLDGLPVSRRTGLAPTL